MPRYFSLPSFIYIALQLIVLIGFYLMPSDVNGQETPNQKELRTYPIWAKSTEAYKNKDYKSAIDLLIKAIPEGEKDITHLINVYELLARAEVINNNPEEALEYLEKAVDLGFGSSIYQYAFLSRNPQYAVLRQNKKWATLLSKNRHNYAKQVESNGDSPEVQMLFAEDQADRSYPPAELSKEPPGSPLRIKLFSQLAKSDAQRKKATKILMSRGKLRSSNDYRSAAFIFQHSGDISDIKLAKKFAQRSYDLAHDYKERRAAGGLVAATTDRLLWYQGKPQIYGTQYRESSMTFDSYVELTKRINGFLKKGEEVPLNIFHQVKLKEAKPTMDPFDTKKIADEERIKLCVPVIEKSLSGTVKSR